MAGMSWTQPPPVVVIGGTEPFLVDREIKGAVLATEKTGRRVVWADTDADAVDAITVAETFGDSALIVVPLKEVSIETILAIKQHQPFRTCLLIRGDGPLNENKYPLLKEVHGAFTRVHSAPTTKKDLKERGVAFARREADRLVAKKALGEKLAVALVKAVGTDLGVISFEVAKMAALARSEKSQEISVDHVRALLRRSSDVDMSSLREALQERNSFKMAQALDLIRRTSGSDPVMLLLRAKGGPADLALRWLRAAILLERGLSIEEIAVRIETPEWATKRDVVPAARRWGSSALRDLVKNLSKVDRGVLQGSPSPWVSCESALLLGCTG